MIVQIKIDKEGTMQTQTLLQKLTFSTAMKVLGCIGAILTVWKGLKEPSFAAGLQDPLLYSGLVMTLQGFFGKSNAAHGTPDAPIPAAQAQQIAAVAASVPPAVVSFVGEPLNGSAVVFGVKAGDPTPVGDTVTDQRGKFRKIAADAYEKTA